MRTTMERCLLLALTLCLCALLTSGLALLTAESRDSRSARSVNSLTSNGLTSGQSCQSVECVTAAADISRYIDPAVKPCDDFYQFACGGWLASNKLEAGQSILTLDDRNWDKHDQLISILSATADDQVDNGQDVPTYLRKFKSFYQSCTNMTKADELGDKPILDMIDRLGGMPLLQTGLWESHDSHDLTDLIGQLQTSYLDSGFSLFAVGLIPDRENVSRFSIYVTPPLVNIAIQRLSSYSISNHVTGSNVSGATPYLQTYRQAVYDIARYLGVPYNAQLEEDIQDMVGLAQNLSAIATGNDLGTLLLGGSRVTTLQELDTLTGSISWSRLLKQLFPSRDILPTERITIRDYQYFSKLDEVLRNSTQRTIWNTIMFRLLQRSIQATTERSNPVWRRSGPLIFGTNPMTRPAYCASLVGDELGSYSALLRRHFHDGIESNVRNMAANLRAKFIQLVDQASWMDDETRSYAIQKITAMDIALGYRKRDAINDTFVDFYYQNLTIDSNGPFLEVYRNFSQFKWTQYSKRLTKVNNRSEWKEDLSMMRHPVGFYSYPDNSLDFLLGSLVGLIYNHKRPDYLNYASLGFSMAEEMVKSCGKRGANYGADGKPLSWWSAGTLVNYAARSQCVREQLTQLASQNNVNVNLNLMSEQTLSDIAGLKLAYKSYAESGKSAADHLSLPLPALPYDTRQLFFISYTHMMCAQISDRFSQSVLNAYGRAPPKLRVMASLINSDEFQSAFQCAPGSRMNPVPAPGKDKCYLY